MKMKYNHNDILLADTNKIILIIGYSLTIPSKYMICFNNKILFIKRNIIENHCVKIGVL